MLTDPSLRLAHECVASEESYEKSVEIMSREIRIPCSKRFNSLYNEKDAHRALVSLSISNAYAESGMKDLAIEARKKIAADVSRPDLKASVPSGSWLRDAAEKTPEKEMKEMLENALTSTVSKIKGFGVFNAPIIAALDKHKIPRYDEKPESVLVRSKYTDGTTTFETYCNLQSVEPQRRAQITCVQVGAFDEKADVVEKLVIQSKMQRIEIALLLMDREFFASPTINRLKRLDQTFLMPAILTKGVKRALQEYVEGKRDQISECTLTPNEGEQAKFTLVIMPRAGWPAEETDPLKKYIPFATNIPLSVILWNIQRLPKDYRMRWGIESGYVAVEQFRARTTSRNHTLRLLYFYYALILYNAWLLANLILAKKSCAAAPSLVSSPIITVALMKTVFHLLILESMIVRRNGRTHQEGGEHACPEHIPV